jgi:hypothetical protein
MLWVTVLAVITAFVALTVKVTRAVDAGLQQQTSARGTWVANTVRDASADE